MLLTCRLVQILTIDDADGVSVTHLDLEASSSAELGELHGRWSPNGDFITVAGFLYEDHQIGDAAIYSAHSGAHLVEIHISGDRAWPAWVPAGATAMSTSPAAYCLVPDSEALLMQSAQDRSSLHIHTHATSVHTQMSGESHLLLHAGPSPAWECSMQRPICIQQIH